MKEDSLGGLAGGLNLGYPLLASSLILAPSPLSTSAYGGGTHTKGEVRK